MSTAFQSLSELLEKVEATKKRLEEDGYRVVVIPKIVVEVAYNEIQQSPRLPSQMALCFARITRIRDDKSPERANDIGQVRDIYEREFCNREKTRVITERRKFGLSEFFAYFSVT